MNKYVKVFTFILVAFLVSISTASAKTLTEVLAQVDAYRAAKNELSEGNKLTDSSVYIIGKHVFTSNHEIKAEELYFAGSTSGTILGKLEDVNLIEVSRKYNADTYEYGDWDLENITTVWGTPDDNYSDNDYTINYIDLEEQDNRTVINTDDSVVSYVGDLNEDNGYFTASLSDDKKTVVVNLLHDVTAANIDEVSQTNIINGLIKLLTNDGDNASVYSKIVLQAGTSTPTEITRADISDAGALKTKVGTFLKTLMDVTYKDMISQSFNVTFEYDQELYKNDTSNTVYTVKFGKKVDVSKYFKLDNTDDKYYFTTIDGKQVLNIKDTSSDFEAAIKSFTKVVKNAFDDKSVTNVILTIDGNNIYKYNYNSELDTDALGATLISNLKNAGLEDFDDLSAVDVNVAFTFRNEVQDVNSKSNYDVTIESYVDIDKILAAVLEGSNVDVNGNELTVNVELVDNKVASLVSTLKALATKINTNVKTAEIASLTINDYDPVDDYANSSDALYTALFRYAFIKATGKSLMANITGGDLANLELTLTAKTASGKKFRDGTDTATYTIKFNVTGVDVDKAFESLTDASELIFDKVTLGDKEIDDTTKKVLSVNLINLATKIDDVNATGVLGGLANYVGLFKTVTVGNTSIDLTKAITNDELGNIKASIIAELKNNKADATLFDLVNNKTTLDATVELADNVNTEGTHEPITVTIEFVSDRIQTVSAEETLDELVGDSSDAEVVYLTADTTVDAELDIKNEGLTIIGDKSVTIDQNVKVSAKNVTLKDVNIEGFLTIDEVAEGAKVEGGSVEGKVAVKGKDAVIDGTTINGTYDKATDASTDIFVVDATGENFTMKNADVSYAKNADKYAYGLLHLTGKPTIEHNTIDITNVKNPIEFAYGATAESGTSISHNTFTGTNEGSLKGTAPASPARNVISIYGVKSVENGSANITIDSNTFTYANWAVRISNYGNNKVNYIITNNEVASNVVGDENTDKQIAFLGVQSVTSGDELGNITIVFQKNKLNGKLYNYDSTKIATQDASLTDRFAYVGTGTPNFISQDAQE